MKKAVIYSRVSTTGQDYQSQIEDLQRYAKVANLQIVEVFAEKVSGYDLTVERSEFDRLKEYVVVNSIDLIICWELSRFGRNSLHTLTEIDFFSKKKIDIYFKKENINTMSDDPMSKLVINLLSSIAEMERNTTVSRIKRGMFSSALKGKRVGMANVPFGFSVDENNYLVINEEEARHIRMIYEMAAQGISLRKISAELNSRKILTRKSSLGQKRTLKNGDVIDIVWRHTTVKKLLDSTVYKGERKYKDEKNIQVPQIVSVELWNKVKDICSNNVGYINNTKYDYLFKGKIFCGKCGYYMATKTRKTNYGLQSYYHCSTKHEQGIFCDGGQFDNRVFDEMIYTQLFKNTSLLEKVYAETAKEFNLEEKLGQIEHYKSEIGKQETRKKRVNSLFKDGFIDESEMRQEHSMVRNHTLEMDNNITKLEKEIANHNEVEIGNLLFQLVDETNFEIKRDFVIKYVDKVLKYDVKSYDIDYSKLYSGRMEDEHWWEGDWVQLKNPHGNDKLIYVELYAFSNPNPLKISLTNVSKQCFISDKLHYTNGHLSLNP